MEKWIEVKVSVGKDAIEGVSNFLFELGAVGLVEQEGALSSFFQYNVWSPKSLEALKNYLLQLRELRFSVDPAQVSVKTIPEQDWGSAWKAHFKPIFVSTRIVVKPPWEELQPLPGQIIIEIDPGRAFGTGNHPSTQLALRFLERYLSSQDEILDIGTGSGILAIAAAKLGAKKIVALEVDHHALENAKRNLSLNRVAKKVLQLKGGIERVKGEKFDLILANLNKEILLEILDPVGELLKSCGHLILSGLLVEDICTIREKLAEVHLAVQNEAVMNDWVSLVVGKSQPCVD